jgi:hypothetical protein
VNTYPVGRQEPGQHEPGWYEIQLQGRLDERWSTLFDGMTLSTAADSNGAGAITVLRGRVVDQAALHGLLARLRDIGLPLISVARLEPAPEDR